MENEETLISEIDIRRHNTIRGGLEYETVIKTWTRYRIPWKKSTKNSGENMILLKN